MKSYGQYCSVAKALDVVGDRWTLLIVRELLLQGPCRYRDLQRGLPGIATNLLATRLRDLEAAGIVSRAAAPPPAAASAFSLTERGRRLEGVLEALGLWGADYIVQSVAEAAEGPDAVADWGEFRAHWLSFPVSMFFPDQDPGSPPVVVEVRAGGEGLVIERLAGRVATRPPAPEDRADLVLDGPPPLLIGVLSGHLPVPVARRRGLTVEGDAGALDRLRTPGRRPPGGGRRSVGAATGATGRSWAHGGEGTGGDRG